MLMDAILLICCVLRCVVVIGYFRDNREYDEGGSVGYGEGVGRLSGMRGWAGLGRGEGNVCSDRVGAGGGVEDR